LGSSRGAEALFWEVTEELGQTFRKEVTLLAISRWVRKRPETKGKKKKKKKKKRRKKKKKKKRKEKKKKKKEKKKKEKNAKKALVNTKTKKAEGETDNEETRWLQNRRSA